MFYKSCIIMLIQTGSEIFKSNTNTQAGCFQRSQIYIFFPIDGVESLINYHYTSGKYSSNLNNFHNRLLKNMEASDNMKLTITATNVQHSTFQVMCSVEKKQKNIGVGVKIRRLGGSVVSDGRP